MKVFVYWNLHRGQWSVKALEGPDKGRVIARQPAVLLKNVEGKVSEAGRQRVLREGRKNVHAGMVGTLVDPIGKHNVIDLLRDWIGDKVTYNPRKYTSFVHVVDESRFEGASYAYMDADRSVYVA